MSQSQEESGYSDSDVQENSESEEKKSQIRFAAVRVYLGKRDVQFVPVDYILNFDPKKKDFPYLANIATSVNEENETVYEPGNVLLTSTCKKDLEKKSSRWPKPNIRRSTALQLLAEQNVAASEKLHETDLTEPEKASSKSRSRNNVTGVTKNALKMPAAPTNFADAMNSCAMMNISNLQFADDSQKTNDEVLEEKNAEIERLKEALRKAMEKEKNISESDAVNVKHINAQSHRGMGFTVNPGTSNSTLIAKSSSSHHLTLKKIASTEQSKSPQYSMTPRWSPRGLTVNSKKISMCNRNAHIDDSQIPASSKRSAQKQSPRYSITPRKSRGGFSVDSSNEAMGLRNDRESPLTKTQKFATAKSPSERSTENTSPQYSMTPRRSPRGLSLGRKPESTESSHESEIEDEEDGVKGENRPQQLKKKMKTEEEKQSVSKYVKKSHDFTYTLDDYLKSGLQIREEFSQWTEKVVDPKTGRESNIDMIHLHFGVSVKLKNWRDACKAKTAKQFLKIMLLHIFEPKECVKLAVQVERTKPTEKRVYVPSRQYSALKKVWMQFLVRKKTIKAKCTDASESKKRKRIIDGFGRELGIVINQIRTHYFCLEKHGMLSEFFQDTDDEEIEQEEIIE